MKHHGNMDCQSLLQLCFSEKTKKVTCILYLGKNATMYIDKKIHSLLQVVEDCIAIQIIKFHAKNQIAGFAVALHQLLLTWLQKGNNLSILQDLRIGSLVL